jgi:hypothetical protein
MALSAIPSQLSVTVPLFVQITAARQVIKTDCSVGVTAVGNTCCDILVIVEGPANKNDNTVS